MSLLLFWHGFTARFARAAEIAEGFFFSLSADPPKSAADRKGRKLKTHALRAIGSRPILNPSRISNFLRLRQIVLYVCRPLNGKHKTNILCVLCASAVNKKLNLIYNPAKGKTYDTKTSHADCLRRQRPDKKRTARNS
jgi:hypothetical protein